MRKLFLILLLGMFLFGCRTDNTYPDIPTLEFKSLTFSKASNGFPIFTLNATFTDGDGDVGYYQDRPNDPIFDDKQSPYYNDFVLGLQVLKNGTWADSVIIVMEINYNSPSTEADNDTTYSNYNDNISERLPYLTQDGKNKGLKGDIEKSAFLPIPFADTIRFSAFIYDRALHKSNIIYTPGYYINTP